MLLLALALASQPDQLLAGSAFETLASRTEAICPARKVRAITPGDLDEAEQRFEAQLPHRARSRLQAANTAERRCADRDGLACPTTATLETIRRIGLMARFASYICSHPAAF